MDNSSAESKSFSFNKTVANKDKQTKGESNVPPVEELIDKLPETKANSVAAEVDDAEYTDNRTVTIMLVKSYSLYRKANDKVLPKRRDFIGSSVSSSRILASNKKEIEAYFPNLIGLASNNPDFITRVKQYLNNIKIPVDELGKTFDISFHYYHKSDYEKIKKQEQAIEDEYQKTDRRDVTKIHKALKEKITKLNLLESTKYALGYPVNLEDYLMYRHCLLYKDIAKDVAVINSDANVRFYFKDDRKEEEKRKKFRQEVVKAKANYVTALSDPSLFDAIYVQYCAMNNLPILPSLAEDRLDREVKLDKFSTDEPVKFNKMFSDKDAKLIAMIEVLISRGELTRSQYNQNILTSDGAFIGANMKEAIAWFKDPTNNEAVEAYKIKLKNI